MSRHSNAAGVECDGAEQLFTAGVPVDTIDCENNTALHHACSHVSTSTD